MAVEPTTGTISTCMILSNTRIIPSLGARKLRDLSAEDVERWLADKAATLSTRTLPLLAPRVGEPALTETLLSGLASQARHLR